MLRLMSFLEIVDLIEEHQMNIQEDKKISNQIVVLFQLETVVMTHNDLRFFCDVEPHKDAHKRTHEYLQIVTFGRR